MPCLSRMADNYIIERKWILCLKELVSGRNSGMANQEGDFENIAFLLLKKNLCRVIAVIKLPILTIIIVFWGKQCALSSNFISLVLFTNCSPPMIKYIQMP